MKHAYHSTIQYCSICYQILAYVVQQASGMPYSRFVQQAILDPQQMTSRYSLALPLNRNNYFWAAIK
jgi:CubicO group peptidase (beta-lactamase class C family)